MRVARLRAWRAIGLAGLALAALTLLFWKLRILDTGVDLGLTLENLDLYDSHYPMMEFGFRALREGRLPLWNPWQFVGEPFLAAYYGGLFYPGNAVYLLTRVPLAIEISGALHMLFGAAGMAALARRLSIGWLGALAAGFTFVWSGWFVFSVNQPRILVAIAWLPWSAWLVDRVLAGERRAGLTFTLGIAAQLLIGDAEHVLHGWLVAALLGLLRLGGLAARGALRDALARAGLCAAGLLAGAGLTAFQLLPTFELVQQTARASLALDAQYAISQGVLAPASFYWQATQSQGWVTTGVLTVVAAALALGRGRGPLPWLLGALAALAGAQLVCGGALFRLYHELPFAELFRRPYKFLDVYAFGQALLAGLAVARLEDRVQTPRRRLWSDPLWLAALALAAVVLFTLPQGVRSSPALLALLLVLLLFGALGAGAGRRAATAALVGLQLASLFFGASNTYVRPLQREATVAARREIFELVRARGDQARLYVSPRLWSVPGFSLKQGMLAQVGVTNDYEPLALARYAAYFGAVSSWRSPDGLFNGRYRLVGSPRWDLLDLTGTRFYAVRGTEPAAALMGGLPAGPGRAGFRRLADGEVQVFERDAALPRAWWVPRARSVRDDGAALAALLAPDFDPLREVILERDGADAAAPAPSAGGAPRVAIDAYAPERVDVSVDAPAPGWLVLSDLFYPGWQATLDGRPVAIERANHLFRAVPVGAGASRVRFEFRPATLRSGAGVSVATALLLVGASLLAARRRSRAPKAV